jgi:hypothetical protein
MESAAGRNKPGHDEALHPGALQRQIIVLPRRHLDVLVF